MPLHSSNSPLYLIFFASGSPSWCPDCRSSLPLLQSIFSSSSSSSSPQAFLLTVDRQEWKDEENLHVFRSRWNVQCVPCILRLENGKEVARLDDEGCNSEEKLRKFVA
ncbi:Uncharacterized conserved protein [Ceraceosorus bombacis]|uniref:Uncharacterized conserved protein n=1 Tax=Ceraceosorus bombacis TaxID=401625 RepID=A0A0P1B9R5_9BASI|nr:Uncharacterized conserved protein [Ceraceosorus bombacis]